MQYQYVVSAQKSSTVIDSACGSFAAPDTTNLIVAKGSRLEIYVVNTEATPVADGSTRLQLLEEVRLNGNVATVDFIQPSDRATGVVVVTSERQQFAILSWDAAARRVATESSGTLTQATGRPTTERRIVAVDPESRVIAVYAYQGIVQLLPLAGATEQRDWRALLRASGVDGAPNSARAAKDIGGLTTATVTSGGRWPYAVREHTGGWAGIPRYLQTGGLAGVQQEQPTAGVRDKGKAAAHAERSSDVYAAVTQHIRELRVVDMQFLRDTGSPIFAVLHEDAGMQRQVHVYRLSAAEAGGLQATSEWTSTALDASAARLVALPDGAVLVLGAEALAVVGHYGESLRVAKRAADVAAWEWLDDARRERLVIADSAGDVSLVVLRYADAGSGTQRVADVCVERLGAAPVATSLAYLGAGCVYIGSHGGDHILARLHTQPLSPAQADDSVRRVMHMWMDSPDADGPVTGGRARLLESPLGGGERQAAANTFVEALESSSSLAPLVDLRVMGARAGGSRYGGVVACTGLRTTPSVRVVRNGIGVAAEFNVDIPGLLGLWALTAEAYAGASRQQLVVAGLANRTLLLAWTEPGGAVLEIAAVQLRGWRLDEPTLAAGLVCAGRCAVQVTPHAVVLLEVDGWTRRAEWTPHDAGFETISTAAVSDCAVALAVDGATVVFLEVRSDSFHLVARRQLPQDASCIAVHEWPDLTRHVAVGLWGSNDVRLLALPALSEVPYGPSVHLSQEIMPNTAPDYPVRSMLLCSLGGSPFLLAGCGDGRLHHFALDAQQDWRVREHKCVSLGSGPLSLAPFVRDDAPAVFVAGGSRSAVLFAAARQPDAIHVPRLVYANVDVPGIQRVAPIVGSAAFPAALCLVRNGRHLSIGRADPVQRLHVHCHPLPPNAVPLRIAHCAALAVHTVATVHSLDDALQPSDVGVADADAWARLALMDTNPQQAALLGDVREELLVHPPAEAARISVLDAHSMDVRASLLLRPYEMPECLCAASLTSLAFPGTAPQVSHDSTLTAAEEESADAALQNAFVLGTSIVLPGEDDAKRGRIIVTRWDPAQTQIHVVGCFTAQAAVYALSTFRGMLLAAVGSRLLLLGWQRRAPLSAPPSTPRSICEGVMYFEDSDHELVVLCSQQAQIASLSLAVNGDYIAVGDLMSSVALFRYEKYVVDSPADARSDLSLPSGAPTDALPSVPLVRHRLVPVARDYAGVWTTALAAVPAPFEQNIPRLCPAPVDQETGFLSCNSELEFSTAFQSPLNERFLVSDAYGNLIRLARAVERPAQQSRGNHGLGDEERLYAEGRWHLGDMVNVVKPGSLVMDIPDPEFPGIFRPQLVYGTLHGAIGVVASVEDGKIGRLLARLQTNMAHLLPTPGLWDYSLWRGYSSDLASSLPFGFLDGDLIESFLDLTPDIQKLIFTGASAHVDAELLEKAEFVQKSDYWSSYSRVEAEGEVAVFSQMAVSDIGLREDVSLDYVVRLVECLTRLH
ncbi:DNA damage-binding protein 1a [Coemansia sp. RSA 988]|nr:DNA damage-binding protein 1a [Coemansia sp. RSA 988]